MTTTTPETPTILATPVVVPAGVKSLPMLANSIALIMGKLFTMGLGFLAWLAAARLFDQAEVGLASGAVSAMMLCVQIALFGAGAAIITLYPRHRSNPERLLNASFTLVTLASLLVSGAFLVIATLFLDQLDVIARRPAYALAFVVMAVSGTLCVLLDQFSTALRRGDQALVRGIATGVVTLGMVVLLPVGLDAETALALLVAWAVGNLAPVLVGAWQIHHSLPEYRLRMQVDLPLIRLINRVGLPNWVLTLTERAPGAILPVIVIEILSPQANAAWYAAWMMAWVVYIVPIQVGLNLFAEASHRPEEMDKALRQGILTSLVIGIASAIAAAVIGPYLLEFLGSGYADEGTTPLRILLVAVVPFTFVQAYFAICRSRMMLREAIVVGTISAVSGIGGAAIMGRNHGLNGMAMAWLITQSLVSIWALYRLRILRTMSGPADDALLAV
jgi:O-antigen/teichoic acid export membrane protein